MSGMNADKSGSTVLSRAPFRIGRVALTVRDLASVSRFYQDVIGLSSIDKSDGTERLGIGQMVLLDLIEDRTATPVSPRDAGLFHTAFLLPSRADLGSWANFVAGRQIPLQGASDHLVSEAIYLADPEGNGIEVYRDRADHEWPFSDGQLQMATDPLDAQGLMKEGRSKAWAGFPEGGFVGHVHLQVGALNEADSFYSGLLGFDVMCRYPGASFYGSGGYHHQLAGNIWNSRGAGKRPSRATGLREVELDTRDAKIFAETQKRVESAELILAQSQNEFRVQDSFDTVFVIRHVH